MWMGSSTESRECDWTWTGNVAGGETEAGEADEKQGKQMNTRENVLGRGWEMLMGE